MERPTGRYIRVLCGAYKQGVSNDSNPAIALGELEIYTTLGYEVERAIAPLFPIVAASTMTDAIQIDGDRTGEFHDGDSVQIVESTANDGTYTIDTVAFGAGKTAMTFTTSLPDGTADGYVLTREPYAYLDGTTVDRRHIDMWHRMGDHWETSREDFGTKYSGAVAADIALQTLEESIRLFEEVTYTSICDPRVELWDTVLAPDDMNGDTELLVQEIELNCSNDSQATKITGVDYSGEALGE